jgi:antitoxin ChpS
MHTTLRQVGGSVMLAVPQFILDLLGLEPGSQVELLVDNGRLVIQSTSKPRYSLDELLAQCEPDVAISREDRDWLDLPSFGREL